MTCQQTTAENVSFALNTRGDPSLPPDPETPGPGPQLPPPAPEPPLPQPPGQPPEGPQPIEEPPGIPPEVPKPVGDPPPDFPRPAGPGRRNPPVQVGSRIIRFLACEDRDHKRTRRGIGCSLAVR